MSLNVLKYNKAILIYNSERVGHTREPPKHDWGPTEHNWGRPMKCENCGGEFRDAYALQRHKNRKTPCVSAANPDPSPEKGFSCKYCQRRFATKPSMARHIRQFCKLAEPAGGPAAEKSTDYELQKRVTCLAQQNAELKAELKAQNESLQLKIERIADIIARQQLVSTVDVRTTNNFNIIVGFDRDDRIRIPVSLVKAAFSENPKLIEYREMDDKDQTDADKAAPYVLEALVDLIRRAHQDPIYRNIHLNPKRADQVMVCLDGEGRSPGPERSPHPQRWEVRILADAIRLLFDGVVNDLSRHIVSPVSMSQLPLDVRGAAAWIPNLYMNDPERYVQDGRMPMSAHFQNMRPDAVRCDPARAQAVHSL